MSATVKQADLPNVDIQEAVPPRRVLVIDDNLSIHGDFRKILGTAVIANHDLDAEAAALFGAPLPQFQPVTAEFVIESAYQGREGYDLVCRAVEAERPFALAFIDMRMPPGWSGVETMRRIWEVDPQLLMVLCTAYLDVSWEKMVAEFGRGDRFIILKKPFDHVEVRQLTTALCARGMAARQAERELASLERQVADSTREMEARSLDLERTAQEIRALGAQLEAARSAAVVAYRAKAQAGSHLASEITNPATAIANFAAELRDDGDLSQAPPSRVRTIDAILQHADQLVKLLNGLHGQASEKG